LFSEQSKLIQDKNEFVHHQQEWHQVGANEVEHIIHLHIELDNAHQAILDHNHQLYCDQDLLCQDTSATHSQVLDANINITKQLQGLVLFMGHIHHITEAMELSFPTPSIALGTVLNQIRYLIEKQAIQR
jgi:hypothetical protein